MPRKILFLVLLFLVSCKGEKGDPGAAGISAGEMKMYTGGVFSDNFFVTNSDIALARQYSVYIAVGGSHIQIPILNTGGGFNVFYTKSGSSINIINALAGGAVSYTIVLLL